MQRAGRDELRLPGTGDGGDVVKTDGDGVKTMLLVDKKMTEAVMAITGGWMSRQAKSGVFTL